MKQLNPCYTIAVAFCVLILSCAKTSVEDKSNSSHKAGNNTARITDGLKYSKNWQYNSDHGQIAIYLLKRESWPKFAEAYTGAFEVRHYIRISNNITRIYDIVYWKNSDYKTIASFITPGGLRMGDLKIENGKLAPYNCITCSSDHQPPPMLSYEQWLHNWCQQMPSSLLCITDPVNNNNNCCILESIMPEGENSSCTSPCGGGGGVLINNGEDPYITAALAAWDNSINYTNILPCEQRVLDTLKTLQSGKIARIIRDLYGSTPGFNWKILDTLNYVSIAEANAITIPTLGPIETYIVRPRMQNATNLFYAATLLHEAAHAFLYDYYNKSLHLPFVFRDSMLQAPYSTMMDNYIKLTVPPGNNAQHDMLLNFQNDIYAALLEYSARTGIISSNISNICYQLSWMGLQGTDYYLNTFSEPFRADIQAQWEAERIGTFFDVYSGHTYIAAGSKACQ